MLSAFVVGLLGSGHCLGMCGGIAASFSPAISEQQTLQRFSSTLIFNLGRISSYIIAGTLAGALSFVLGNELEIRFWSDLMRLLTGITIALIGLGLLLRSPLINALERFGRPIWRRIAPLATALQPVKTPWSGFVLGMLWGWIPCGMVYSMLLVALMSGQPHYGALTMGFFGLGTLPALVLSGLLFARLGHWGRHHQITRYAGVLCLVLGLWTALAPHLPMPEAQQHPLSANASLCETPASL
ncbi:MAG: sulfite exporter TauE/SafE family protein [Gammaproteobacteria bacterium]|nr:sulfite exporter TauE/SafE family protein [Gammaproteobacteria bacterium]